MLNLIVVDNSKQYRFDLDDVEVVSAKTYLTNSAYLELRNARVYNLCRSHRYQSAGYYVSLLAQARGHKVFPSITTIQDLKSQTIVRLISDDLDQLIQKNLAKIKSPTFDLSIYFGKNIAKQYNELSKQLFNMFQAPLLRANFVFNKKWILRNINAISLNEIPESHNRYFVEFAKQYFAKKRIHQPKRSIGVYDLAILLNSEDKYPPSDKKAISNFAEAAEDIGFNVSIINKHDFSRIAEFDALFIRETTAVNHHTYRFAQRAKAEELVVIDDPESIVKCTNKVYIAELLNKFKVPRPKTLIVYKDNQEIVGSSLGFPCVLKKPDSSFSRGVIKVDNKHDLQKELDLMLQKSELVIAQEFIPTAFDWRIGVLDNQPLFACRYYMADKHWQIYNWNSKNERMGKFDVVPMEEVPAIVLKNALRSANLIGDGFYGVDLKETRGNAYVMEINDNPNIDSGVEDLYLKEKLYQQIMQSIFNRIQKNKDKIASNGK
jgi:glutathione synthase/RimK-type ligase-like ATP-grasp enzyme